MLGSIVFWIFQLLNGYAAASLVVAPQSSHEKTFAEPERVYRQLGFSETARGMLHNVLRGQGAALLAITAYLFFRGPAQRDSFLLIALTCLLAGATHVMTYRHHTRDAVVRETLGASIKSIHGLIAVNAVVGGAALLVFLSGQQ